MAFAPTYQFAGPNSGYVPAFDETAKLIVNYSRDWKKNKINQMMTLTPVNRQVGLYPHINPLTKVNVTSTYLQSRKWPDGQPAPLDQLGSTQFEWETYFCQRYFEGEALGYNMKEQTAFDIEQVILDTLANRMMTAKAVEFYGVLQDVNSYPAGNTASATSAGGGQWNAATSTNRYIQKSLAAGTEAIVLATGGGVKASDLMLVVDPVVAHKMAASGEIADYLAQNPVAPEYLQGTLFADQLAQYGLPPMLYGIKVIVDENVQATNSLGATAATSFIPGDTSAYLFARPGQLVGMAGGSNFSFVHCFQYAKEEMLVETLDDVPNKRYLIRIIDNRTIKAVGQESGFYFTAVVA